VVLWM